MKKNQRAEHNFYSADHGPPTKHKKILEGLKNHLLMF